MNVNKAIIVGNITKDPEIKSLPSGVQVCSFSVATNEVYTTKDNQKQEKTEFHNIVAFGRLAENISKYMKKGSQIYIEGKIQTRSWDDQQTGQKKYRTEILAQNVQFGSRPANSPASAPRSAESSPADSMEFPDENINTDDIPF